MANDCSVKKAALAAASFPTSRHLVKKALALAQALAAASFPRSRQLSKLPPSLGAACAPVAYVMWLCTVDGAIVEALS